MSPASAPYLEQETDTEITLGTGKMLILFFGLVLLCAVFFGMGFTMGKNAVRSAPELQATPNGVRPSAANSSATKTATPSQATAPATQSAPDNALTSSGQPAQQAPSGNDQNPTQGSGAQQPALSGPGYFVQVAAVSKQEDADALVEALKGHGYAALIAAPTSYKLYHVQVGPFADIKDAESTRAKLVSDGYSPILKK